MMDTEFDLGVAGIFQGGEPGDIEAYTMPEEHVWGSYIASLITSDEGGLVLEDVHITSNPTDPRKGVLVAGSIRSGINDSIYRQGYGTNNKYVQQMNLNESSTNTYAEGVRSLVDTALKDKGYMNWGYFTVPTKMSTAEGGDSQADHYIDNRSYYISGELINNTVRDAFTGTVN